MMRITTLTYLPNRLSKGARFQIVGDVGGGLVPPSQLVKVGLEGFGPSGQATTWLGAVQAQAGSFRFAGELPQSIVVGNVLVGVDVGEKRYQMRFVASVIDPSGLNIAGSATGVIAWE